MRSKLQVNICPAPSLSENEGHEVEGAAMGALTCGSKGS